MAVLITGFDARQVFADTLEISDMMTREPKKAISQQNEFMKTLIRQQGIQNGKTIHIPQKTEVYI
jgi:hypothetical protein